MKKENFNITIEYIDKNNHSEGFCICCHSDLEGIVMDSYGINKKELLQKIDKRYKNINKIIDYTLKKKI